MLPRPRPAEVTTAVERQAADPLAACRSGACDHFHFRPVDDPQLRAERRVRDALHELDAAIGCLPAGHSLRRQYQAGELYAPWRLRADALLHRIERERDEWQSLQVAMAWAGATA